MKSGHKFAPFIVSRFLSDCDYVKGLQSVFFFLFFMSFATQIQIILWTRTALAQNCGCEKSPNCLQTEFVRYGQLSVSCTFLPISHAHMAFGKRMLENVHIPRWGFVCSCVSCASIAKCIGMAGNIITPQRSTKTVRML